MALPKPVKRLGKKAVDTRQVDFLSIETHSPAALLATEPQPAAAVSTWATRAATARKAARTGTFVDNLKLPIHRWFRYSAGFSAKWVESVLKDKKSLNVFDPFAGSGTTMLAADAMGVPSVGTESHPFVKRVANAKLSWNFEANTLHRTASS